MTKKIKILLLLLAAAASFFWLSYLQITHQKQTTGTNIYEILNTILPLTGGLLGLHSAKKYSGRKSTLGLGIILTSLGIIAWSLGQMAWSYYNIHSKIDVPYPSLADVGYLAAIPLWFVGMMLISTVMGVKYQLRKTSGKLMLVIIPAISVLLSYYLLIKVGRHGWPQHNQINVKFFTDLAYPTGDALVASVALTIYVLSKNYVGGRFKWPVLFTLLGFIGMYGADFLLAYGTTKDFYYGGSWVDSIYTIALALIGFSLVLMDPSSVKGGKNKIDGNLSSQQGPNPSQPLNQT